MSRFLARSQNCICVTARHVKLNDELLKFGKRPGVFIRMKYLAYFEPFD